MDSKETFTDSCSFSGEVTLKVLLESIDSKRFILFIMFAKENIRLLQLHSMDFNENW